MDTDADTLGFATVATPPGDSAAKRLMQKAAEVALLYKGTEVSVRITELDSNGHLFGQITDFTQLCSTQYEGLRLGQQLTFRPLHVQHIVKHLSK